VDLERALETQRVRLLRLLTGWFAVVAVMSGGPFAVALPRWVRAVFADLLVRAELAAQCLVQVSARLQAGDRWGFVEDASSSFVPLDAAGRTDDVPSTAALLRRMRALRRLLQNLPHFGRRLLRRLDVGEARVFFGVAPAHDCRTPAASPQWIAPGIERPPDRLGIDLALEWCSRSDRTGGIWRGVKSIRYFKACLHSMGGFPVEENPVTPQVSQRYSRSRRLGSPVATH